MTMTARPTKPPIAEPYSPPQWRLLVSRGTAPAAATLHFALPRLRWGQWRCCKQPWWFWLSVLVVAAPVIASMAFWRCPPPLRGLAALDRHRCSYNRYRCRMHNTRIFDHAMTADGSRSRSVDREVAHHQASRQRHHHRRYFL